MNLLGDCVNNETFVFGKLEIPRRSEFYYLEPIGVGTPYVESLSGYASRLAQEHFLSPSALIRHVVSSAPSLVDAFRSYGRRTLGSRRVTLDLIRVLETITMRRDLVWTTMVTWVNVLPVKTLIRLKRAWCPVCYETWKEKGQVVYDPLLWTLDAVTVCPLHNIFLTSSCPTCKAEIPYFAVRLRPGFCSRCKGWLGDSLESSCSNQIVELNEFGKWQLWKADVMGKLLASAPNITVPVRSHVTRSVRYCLDKYYCGRTSRFTSQLKIVPRNLNGWLSGSSIPIVDMILRITYEVNVSLLSFLCGTLESEENPLAMEEGSKELGTSNSTISMPLSHDEVQKILTSAALSDKPEPLMTFTSITGWSRWRIRHHFPDLYATIITRHRDTYWKPIDRAKALSILRAALKETPPPSLREIADRIGCAVNTIRLNFPEITTESIANYNNYWHESPWKRAEQLLKESLSQYPPVSLTKISRSIGIQKNDLRKKFPELSSAIILRFQEYARTQKEERHKQLWQEVREAVASLEAEGINPSLTRVAARVKALRNRGQICLVLREVKREAANTVTGRNELESHRSGVSAPYTNLTRRLT